MCLGVVEQRDTVEVTRSIDFSCVYYGHVSRHECQAATYRKHLELAAKPCLGASIFGVHSVITDTIKTKSFTNALEQLVSERSLVSPLSLREND